MTSFLTFEINFIYLFDVFELLGSTASGLQMAAKRQKMRLDIHWWWTTGPEELALQQPGVIHPGQVVAIAQFMPEKENFRPL